MGDVYWGVHGVVDPDELRQARRDEGRLARRKRWLTALFLGILAVVHSMFGGSG